MAESEARQRRFPRVPLQYLTLVSRIEDRSRPRETITRSIGLGGCSFELDTHLEPGVAVKLFLAVGLSHLMARARVVYSRPLPTGWYEIGAEFIEVSQDDLQAIARHFNWGSPA